MMIAEPNRHIQSETMRELLEDGLSAEQADVVESHLDSCESCRNELQQLAGQPQWWDETVGVLSQSTMTPKSNLSQSENDDAQSANWSLDSSLEWIRPLLDESPGAGLGRIDHYPVDGLIGQGGMGVVLRGVDPELNRPVAIKILSPHLAGVGAARTRFMREAQAAAAIVHPSIVPIYSIATAARLPYIVMPCISGGNLQERIDRDGPLSLPEVLRIGLQIAEGLEAAHRQGVIHRDIKPANILIEEGNGRVLISDFGLARALDDATLTMSGMIAGTPQYMSPEQARGESVDQRSDLFSLGSLIYSLAIGRPPFRAETPLAVLRKISETSPKPIRQINEQMPDWLDRLVGKLMTIDRSERTASAGEAATLLRDALAHVHDPVQQPLPESLASPPRYFGRIATAGARPLRAVALGLVATLLTVAGFYVGARSWTGDAPAETSEKLQMHGLGMADSKATDQSGSAVSDNTVSDNTVSDNTVANKTVPTATPTATTTGLPATSVLESESQWYGAAIDSGLAEINREIGAIDSILQPWESPQSNVPPRPADAQGE